MPLSIGGTGDLAAETEREKELCARSEKKGQTDTQNNFLGHMSTCHNPYAQLMYSIHVDSDCVHALCMCCNDAYLIHFHQLVLPREVLSLINKKPTKTTQQTTTVQQQQLLLLQLLLLLLQLLLLLLLPRAYRFLRRRGHATKKYIATCTYIDVLKMSNSILENDLVCFCTIIVGGASSSNML